MWKYEFLANIVNSAPKVYGTRIYFRTVSHPFFSDLREGFYEGHRKIIPKELLETEMNPLALAVWIMDDGTNELGSSHCLKINSQSFSYQEHEFLCDLLRKKFGLEANINKDRKYFRIRFYQRNMDNLIHITKPYILPSMTYKLSP